jgi:hypothetical protein
VRRLHQTPDTIAVDVPDAVSFGREAPLSFTNTATHFELPFACAHGNPRNGSPHRRADGEPLSVSHLRGTYGEPQHLAPNIWALLLANGVPQYLAPDIWALLLAHRVPHHVTPDVWALLLTHGVPHPVSDAGALLRAYDAPYRQPHRLH